MADHGLGASMSDERRRAIREAREADLLWFDQHPDRTHRLRRARYAELPVHPDNLAFVLVKQVRRGMCLRQAIYTPTPPPSCDPDERIARMLWDEHLSRNPELADHFACAVAQILGRAP